MSANGEKTLNRLREIRKKMEELINPNSFVLNTEIVKLDKEKQELRNKCSHEFENGECIYCGTQEPIIETE